MSDAEAQLRDEVSRIVAALESLLQRRSRWTGVVSLSDDAAIYGKVSWGGDIAVARDLIAENFRWRTLIHEALHTFSEGLTPSRYADLPGWEEGTVEQAQRLLRREVLSHIGVSVPEDVFRSGDMRHRYNPYVDALEGLRQTLNHPSSEFFLPLLNVALRDRPGYVIGEAQKLPRDRFEAFRRTFGSAFTLLRGE